MIKPYSLMFLLLAELIFPQQKIISFAEGEKLLLNKKYAEAQEIFLNILSNKYENEELQSTAYYYYSKCFFEMGMKDAGVAAFENFTRKYPHSAFNEPVLYNLVKGYFESGENEKVILKSNEFLTKYPYSYYAPEVYYYTGKTYDFLSETEKSETMLVKSISYGKKNQLIEYAIFSAAELNEKKKDYSSAIKYYDQLLSYYPESELCPTAQLRIGYCYYRSGRFENTVLELSDPRINELDKKNKTEADLVMANSYFQLKEYNQAKEKYSEILKSAPDSVTIEMVNFGIARVYFSAAKYDEAYKIFEELKTSASDSIAINSFYLAAESKRMARDSKAAIKIYESFLEKYPATDLAEVARIKLGLIYLENNQIQKSQQYLTKANVTEKKQTKAAALIILGEMSLQRKEFLPAAEYFDSVLVIKKLSDEFKNRALAGKAISLFYMNKMLDSKKILEGLLSSGSKNENIPFYLAEINFSEKKYSDALKYYNLVDSKELKKKLDVLYGKGYSNYNIKKYADAMNFFSEFVKNGKSDKRIIDAKVRLADCYFALKKFDEASAQYKEVIRENVKYKELDNVHYQYAQALFNSGNYDAAIKEFSAMQQLYPQSRYLDESQYFIGWIYFKSAKYNEAITNYKFLFSNYGNSAITPLAYYSIGDSYFNLSQYDSAIVYYKKILEKYPSAGFLFDAINGIQYSYLAKNQPEQAVKLLDDFLNENRNFEFTDQIIFKKGEILFNSNKYGEAITNFNLLINQYSKSKLVPDAYFWKGKCYLETGVKKEALENFNFVINNFPGTELMISSAVEAGKIYTTDSDLQSALNIYNKVTEKMPLSEKSAEIYYLKALINIEQNNVASAYDNLNKLIMYYDGNVFSDKARIEMGVLELARGKYESAEDLFRELGEKKLDDIGAEAQYYYGITLMEQEKINEAVSAFVRVRSVFSIYDEWYTNSLLKLGECYQKLGDNSKAREMYSAVVSRHKNDDYGKQATEKLKELKK